MRRGGERFLAPLSPRLISVKYMEEMTKDSKTKWFDPAWKYRRKISLARDCVANQDQFDFPVWVVMTDPALRSLEHGGHVAKVSGADFLFVLVEDSIKLAHEIEQYVPETGLLRAWVKIPRLSQAKDTVFYLYYGNTQEIYNPDPASVWADDTLVWHGAKTNQERRILSHNLNSSPQSLTVEVWVKAEEVQAEVFQALVSKWAYLPTLDSFEAYDAGATDGLVTKGYFGAVFDGRYVYFAPAYDGTGNHGRVLRFDTHGHFREPASWSAYDAGETSGLSSKGYYGGVFDGRFVYFVPRLDKNFTPEVTHHSRVLRYDTTLEFKDSRSWQAQDAGNPVSYQGAAFDGRYIYFCPGYEHVSTPADDKNYQWSGVTVSGKVLRYDTHGDFTAAASYSTYDASQTSGLETRCYDGAVFDGRYIYFVPLESLGLVLRYDTQGDFMNPVSWTAYDVRQTSGYEPGWCVGAIFDGRYLYLVPYSNGVVVRYDTWGDFNAPGCWLAYDAQHTAGLDARGYDGAVFDGKYIYFIPFHQGQDGSGGFHAQVLRYDTAQNFTDAAAWSAADAAGTGGLNPVGFNGGAFDGRYLYCAPWRDGVQPNGLPAAHGRVLRYDTTGSLASFSLRFTDCGHNGGLCGAVPGPAFLVNTDRGVLNIQAHRTLSPGWHHLAGVYDGAKISLVIDGVVINQRNGSGTIQANETDVIVGQTQEGLGHFRGLIEQVRVSSTARSVDWLRTAYRNLSDPAAFCRVGFEELKIGD